ncbi:MFS transporter [Phormidium pseudopriestleyi FRX01]|uniref:MFS transporter n=1 Tax=Phormidium pseudopriestleyi FRX01 TaxID=1759528 RepID=A0ABS3FKX2_9CYAN|nr:MFS transporter [Phormidium pseudopriestleyi]MBO0347744.1 MFS transporter [Phormidium pseudopriestleyi FRX01]
MTQSKLTIALTLRKPLFSEYLSENSLVLPNGKRSKPAIRNSLQASTLDGVFATFFSCATGGVLLSNFLLDLGASNVEIGFLAAIPMLMNFLQPVGAYLGDRTTSRHWYTLSIFSISRLLWLFLLLGIGWFLMDPRQAHHLVLGTLAIVALTHLLGAFGSPSWVSWMAALVPDRLRGRYFGIRNSAANLTSLLAMPILGVMVSQWDGGTIEGYGIILCVAIAAGIISLCFQFLMADVNPQIWGRDRPTVLNYETTPSSSAIALPSFLKDKNFRIFLLYFGCWMFAVNLSAPFFNLYLLKDLELDVSWVTLYNSLAAGANLLMLPIWGKLADRLGNRPLLFFVGILVAITPVLWLATRTQGILLWVGLPLLHLISGATWAAVDLCGSNIQMEIAPAKQPSSYFAIAAAVSGLAGAIGTTLGGFIATQSAFGGFVGLFAFSAILRLLALIPLLFLQEPRSQSLRQILDNLANFWFKPRLNSHP